MQETWLYYPTLMGSCIRGLSLTGQLDLDLVTLKGKIEGHSHFEGYIP